MISIRTHSLPILDTLPKKNTCASICYHYIFHLLGENTKSQSRPPSLMIFPARNHHFSLGFPSRFCRLRVAWPRCADNLPPWCFRRDALGPRSLRPWSLDPATSPKKGWYVTRTANINKGIQRVNRDYMDFIKYWIIVILWIIVTIWILIRITWKTKMRQRHKIFVFLGIHQVAILGSVWSRFVVRPGSMRWTEPLELGRSDFGHPWILVMLQAERKDD